MTRLLPALRPLAYRDRLSSLHLSSLESRRLRFDLITVFKIVHGLINVPFDHFFRYAIDTRSRGHKFKLYTNFCYSLARSTFFSQRVIPIWKSLPADIVEANSILAFKTLLDNYQPTFSAL